MLCKKWEAPCSSGCTTTHLILDPPPPLNSNNLFLKTQSSAYTQKYQPAYLLSLYGIPQEMFKEAQHTLKHAQSRSKHAQSKLRYTQQMACVVCVKVH